MNAPISLRDIREAAERLQGVATRTPVLENPDVNERLGGRLLLKCENLQRSGAFKLRGAYVRMSQMSAEELARGVISYSSGNHALGLARSAALLRSSAVIVMPEDAAQAKMAAIRALGAQIVTYDRDREESAEVIARIVAETRRIEVPTGGHPQVMAGAGTVALLELAPECALYAAEPELFDDTRRSLAAGERVSNPTGRRTICDAIMTPSPNPMTFEVNRAHLKGGLAVSDAQVRAAMRFAFTHFKLVTEPGAVVGLAAILAGQVPIKGQTVATVITGGNIDAARFARLLEAGDD
ncbi:MAG: threonine/serine dehydratase [Rhodobacteraceae bacterium]|nr:threonine/serine dehydratase [Paracoccaceae bacterium]